jgi:WD40 repeat protein
VAAGYWKGDVVLWQNSGDGPRRGVVLGTGRRPVNDIAFDPSGGVLASGDSGGTITLWRLEKRGSPIRLEGHTREVRTLAFSPDGRTLASGADDGTVLLWDVKEGEALGEALRLGAPVTAVAFAPDGQSLLAVHAALTVWNTALWGPGDDTFEAVRQRFCALVRSETARPSAGDPCQRHG